MNILVVDVVKLTLFPNECNLPSIANYSRTPDRYSRIRLTYNVTYVRITLGLGATLAPSAAKRSQRVPD